jgi:hypothetical protein
MRAGHEGGGHPEHGDDRDDRDEPAGHGPERCPWRERAAKGRSGY